MINFSVSGEWQLSVLLCSVGTSIDPILKAIDKNKPVKCYLVYGRWKGELRPGTKTPEEIATEVQVRYPEIVEKREIADPDDVEVCIRVFTEVFLEILGKFPDAKIIIDFTGGTKAMSSALFYASNIVPIRNRVYEYITGERGENGRVIPGTEKPISRRYIDYQLLRDAIILFNNREFLWAAKLFNEVTSNLEMKEPFLLKLLENISLWLGHWDNFNYDEAKNYAERIKRDIHKVLSVISIRSLRKLEDEFSSLRALFVSSYNCVKFLRDMIEKKNLPEIQKEFGEALIIDLLQKIDIRLERNQYDVAVILAYRVLETAVQLELIKHGVSPWKTNWETIDEEVRNEFLARAGLSNPPENITLRSGLALLAIIDKEFSEKLKSVEKELNHIIYQRNYSPIAHGWINIKKDNAEKARKFAIRFIKETLNINYTPERYKIPKLKITDIIRALIPED